MVGSRYFIFLEISYKYTQTWKKYFSSDQKKWFWSLFRLFSWNMVHRIKGLIRSAKSGSDSKQLSNYDQITSRIDRILRPGMGSCSWKRSRLKKFLPDWKNRRICQSGVVFLYNFFILTVLSSVFETQYGMCYKVFYRCFQERPITI